jgi:Holliday junction resolvasome RuvABC endonuclease subunit
MSLDQSTRVTGYCVFENGEYVCSGVIDKSKSKLETDERSFDMAKDIWKVIAKYKPDELILENVQQQSSVSTVITLARLQGMIIGYAEAHKVKTHILLPSQWRKALSYKQGSKVKRAELKQQSIDYVKEHLGVKMPEDQAEAVCAGFAAHKIYNFTDEEDIWD